MSTLTVAAILVGIVAALCPLLVIINNKQKRKAMNQLLQQFSQLGTAYHLTFSSQEILKEAVLGLDGIHRKLLVLQRQGKNIFHSVVVDLHEVKECSVKKHYGTIKRGDLKKWKLELFLEEIVLQFELRNGKALLQVVFYSHNHNHIFQAGRVDESIAALAAHRTVRESLPSYGSCYSVTI